MFPKIGVPQIGWFILENPIKMDDLGGPPLFLETPILPFTKAKRLLGNHGGVPATTMRKYLSGSVSNSQSNIGEVVWEHLLTHKQSMKKNER